MFLKKLKQSEIAKALGITKQTVNKSISIIEKKIAKSLLDAAKVNRIFVHKIDPLRGVLVGYSPEFKTDVIIFLSAKHGLQVWYKIDHSCNNCSYYNECKRILLDEIEFRGIKLGDDEKSLPPSKLAELLFNNLLEGL